MIPAELDSFWMAVKVSPIQLAIGFELELELELKPAPKIDEAMLDTIKPAHTIV
jgi:hypothetical protein